MEETIRDRYNKLLTVIQRVCNNYTGETNTESIRKKLEDDLCKAIDPYEKEGFINGFDIDCGNSFNPPVTIKRGEVSFMFGITWKGKKEGARHTFGARKI